MFDSVDFEKKKRAKKEKGALEVLVEKSKEAFKSATDKTKEEIAKEMKTLGYTSFADVAKKQNKKDIISLANVLNVEVPQELMNEEKPVEKKGNK